MAESLTAIGGAAVVDDLGARLLPAAAAIGGARPQPRRGGRSRQRGRAGIRAIGVVALGVDNPFTADAAFLTALAGIERAVGRAQRSVLLAAVPGPEQTPDFLRQRVVEGLIIRVPDTPLARRAGAGVLVDRNGLPTMWIFDRVPGARGDECTCDVDRIGFLAVDHFYALGHRRLAFLNPRQGGRQGDAVRGAFAAYARLRGITVQFFEAPVIPTPWPVSLISNASTVGTLVERWASVPAVLRATAIFVPAAETAVHVHAALRRRGCAIPRDVSVISCCDSDALLRDLLPAMTTISVHADLIGERAADALQWRIRYPRAAGTARIVVEPSLVVRDSVGRVRC